MAAVISTQAFAETEITFQSGKEYNIANSTTEYNSNDAIVTINGGDFETFKMGGSAPHYVTQSAIYGASDSGSVSAAVKEYKDVHLKVEGGENINFLIGYSEPCGSKVTGDINITVNNGSITTLIGGAQYKSTGVYGFNNLNNSTAVDQSGSFACWAHKDESDPDINITVTGGTIGQIRGGHNNMTEKVYKSLKTAKNSDETGKAYNAMMADKPWAVAGDITIKISGKDTVITGAKNKAIAGGGGSGCSVDGSISISISDGTINGDIYAGTTNIYTESKGTSVTIDGGVINGSVYGGGNYDNGAENAARYGLDPKIGPTIKNDTVLRLNGGTVQKNVYGAGVGDSVEGSTNIHIGEKGTTVGETIYGGGTDNAVVAKERNLTIDSSYTGTQAYKVADFTNIAVNADATLAEMTAAKEGTDISIAEGKTLKLTGDKTYTASNVEGGTLRIDGAAFALSAADSKLTSDVVLDKHASLDLNGAAVNNTIWVYGCSIKGAESFSGHLIVDGGELELTEPTSADKVTVTNGGSVTGGSLAANKVELIGTNDGAQQPDINTNLSVADNGTITLSGGAVLNVDGSLTLGSGVNIVVGDDYAVGTEIIKVSGDINQEENIEIIFGETKVVVQNGGVWLISRFDQNYADTFTVGNWGIITASRAFVNTVRGQRTNVGCIANGRGTAWAAVMGGNHDIAGSDINLTGAAVGADMKVGRSSSVGVALGYVDGDVKPGSLRSVDQDGTYLAVYGEHGLKKLNATSCLSLDWVAAYGNTESSVNGHDWEQDSLQLNSRLNWNKRINSKVCVNAFGGLEYFASNSDTVAGVKTGSIQSLRGEIGVGARYVAWGTPAVTDGKSGLVLAKGCEKLVLNGEIRYMNDMVRSNPVIRMEGMSGGGTNPGRHGMGIEAGATYRINERWSASANYGFNAMDDSKEHRINAGAAYTF